MLKYESLKSFSDKGYYFKNDSIIIKILCNIYNFMLYSYSENHLM